MFFPRQKMFTARVASFHISANFSNVCQNRRELDSYICFRINPLRHHMSFSPWKTYTRKRMRVKKVSSAMKRVFNPQGPQEVSWALRGVLDHNLRTADLGYRQWNKCLRQNVRQRHRRKEVQKIERSEDRKSTIITAGIMLKKTVVCRRAKNIYKAWVGVKQQKDKHSWMTAHMSSGLRSLPLAVTNFE